MSTRRGRVGRALRTALAVAVTAGACACGPDPFEPSDDDVNADATGTTTATPTAEEKQEDPEEEFGWGLPEGPRTPDDTFEDDVYGPLAAGECGEAQRQLDDLWRLLKSPRGVLLYQAGVDACRGDEQAARAGFARAGQDGWTGVDWVAFGGFAYDCNVYRSLRSVLEQRPRADVGCPGGTPPSWPNPDRSVPRDDPRTPEDETAPTEPPDDPTEPPPTEPTPSATRTP